MKKLKILPGAAGLIALTATMGFVDGEREIEAGFFSRDRITLVSALKDIKPENPLLAEQPALKQDHPAYLVQIRRGERFAEVLVDAITGQVIST